MRIVNRWRDQIRPLEYAKTLMSFPHAGYRSPHAHRAVANDTSAKIVSRNHLAFAVDKHVSRRLERRTLAVIQEVRFALVINRHEPATTDISGLGVGHRQRKCNGDCRINGITAFGEDGIGRVRGQAVWYGNCRSVQLRKRVC
ncbi:hypothetical protein D9M71_571600 [compost metagenome]